MAVGASGRCGPTGATTFYRRVGADGPTVVLLHGLAGDGATWDPVARQLAEVADVVAPDARGHGLSDAPAGGYRYLDLAGDVEALVGELRLAAPVLVGHSMGGVTAALVAARRVVPVRGVVLVDPTFLDADAARALHDSDVVARHHDVLRLTDEGAAAELAARHPRRSRELVELLSRARRRTNVAAYDVLTPPAPDYRGLVRAISEPLLLVVGDTDPVVGRGPARELEGLNPSLRVEEVAGAGHGLPFDRPDRLAEIVRDFLAGLPPTEPPAPRSPVPR